MEKKSQIKFIGTGSSPQSRMDRLKLSWNQHRLIYYAAFVVIFFLVFMFSAFALIIRLAQGQVDDAVLSLIDIKFFEPTSNSVRLTQSASLYSKSHFTPTLDSSTASVYVAENGVFSTQPITKIKVPNIHIQNPASTVSMEDVPINFKSDQEVNQVTDFVYHLLTQETIDLAMVGRTTLKLGLLPRFKVGFNKTTTIKGLDGLKNFNVTDVKMNLTAAPGDPNLSAIASIPNPSIITTEMGNLTFVLSTDIAGVVGHSEIQNLRLSPGINYCLMLSCINQTKIAQSLDKETETVILSVTPVSTDFNGEKLTYFKKAFAANKFSLHLNVTAILANS